MINLRTSSLTATVLAAGTLLVSGGAAVASTKSKSVRLHKRTYHGVRHHRSASKPKVAPKVTKPKVAPTAPAPKVTPTTPPPKVTIPAPAPKVTPPAIAPKVTPPATKPKATPKRKAKAKKAGALRRHGASKHVLHKAKGKAKKGSALRRHRASKHARTHKRRSR